VNEAPLPKAQLDTAFVGQHFNLLFLKTA
ncbi:hypothetical protein Tco_1178924, partial [Tanacetum coccineum]